MTVVRADRLQDMAGDDYDGLVATAALGELGDQGVAVVLPVASDSGTLTDLCPDCLQSSDVPRWVGGLRLDTGGGRNTQAGWRQAFAPTRHGIRPVQEVLRSSPESCGLHRLRSGCVRRSGILSRC